MLVKKTSLGLSKLLRQFEVSQRTLSSQKECHLLTKEIGDKVVLILNRPKSLNALSSTLQTQLTQALIKLEQEKTLIILKGAGNKAFSSGGDVLEVRRSVESGSNSVQGQLAYNLQINMYLIHTCKIPIIAFMNGITYGGGAGMASFCKYKVATENTKFAMPETKIGFHPNAGATYFLNRGRGKVGYYIGLTSDSLQGSDVLHAGFATHFCLSKNLGELEKALINYKNSDNIEDIMNSICESNIPNYTLEGVSSTIDNCFSKNTVEEIFIELEKDGSDWAKKVLKTLKQLAPASLTITLRQLQRGKKLSLEEMLVMEKDLTINFHKFPDVLEGVRCALIDRGDVPKWNPAKYENVTEELIERHFEPVYEGRLEKVLEQLRDRQIGNYPAIPSFQIK